ncbi:hypothetical protein [Streptomyces sp. NPDC004721]
MTTPYERLMAEAIPTRPAPAPKPERPSRLPGPWTAEEQDAHWAELCTEVGATNERRPALRLVTDTVTDAA